MADNKILYRIEDLSARYEELETLITDPQVIADAKRFASLSKEYNRLQNILQVAKTYRTALETMEEALSELKSATDADYKEMLKDMYNEAEASIPQLESEIKQLLLPGDPEDEKNAILEIRAGTGGDEAALFAGDLFKMYSRYCDSKGWQMSVSSFTEGTTGGYKEIVTEIEGDGVYGTLKYESGVHRVQRVPQTETQGRIHTSAASVAVLPEATEFDVEIKESDIRVDTYCSSGAGGQSVNTTYSAVRLVHIPTGIMVQCQDQKSQIKNKAKALVELRSRIYNMEHQKYLDEVASKRKTMVSTGDRSAKIRTYNFPQGRVTDHRIGLTIHNLSGVLSGEIQPVIDALIVAENAERMKEASIE